jgi:hypothetical protein
MKTVNFSDELHAKLLSHFESALEDAKRTIQDVEAIESIGEQIKNLSGFDPSSLNKFERRIHDTSASKRKRIIERLHKEVNEVQQLIHCMNGRYDLAEEMKDNGAHSFTEAAGIKAPNGKSAAAKESKYPTDEMERENCGCLNLLLSALKPFLKKVEDGGSILKTSNEYIELKTLLIEWGNEGKY